MRQARSEAQERDMTERDWKALYLVTRLQEQIVLHGAKALDTFIDAMCERRAMSDKPDGATTRARGRTTSHNSNASTVTVSDHEGNR